MLSKIKIQLSIIWVYITFKASYFFNRICRILKDSWKYAWVRVVCCILIGIVIAIIIIVPFILLFIPRGE